MKLNEKILYCRKKAGMSQEALAEHIGVSRQAISKWETGEAEPEINKFQILAKEFNVTADWLLSDNDPDLGNTAECEPQPTMLVPNTSWIDSIPGTIGRLLRRYGWLFGVYLAIIGTCFAGIGALARYMANSMFISFNSIIPGDMSGLLPGDMDYVQFGNRINNTFTNLATNNPVSIMGTVIIVVGIIMIIAGIVLAIVLKKCSKK